MSLSEGEYEVLEECIEIKHPSTHTHIRTLSACTGAILTSLLVTPFDVVKTRMQSSAYPLSTQSIIRVVVGSEGVKGLWRGLVPTLVMSVPSTVVYYIGYEDVRGRMVARWGEGVYAPLVAGGLARTLAATLTSPLELLRTRMQAGKMRRVRDVRAWIKSEGVRGLWRGLGPTLWRDVPFSGIYWLTYEKTKTHLPNPTSTHIEFRNAFLSGAVAGTIAAILTTPFDVAKTVMQVGAEGGMVPVLREIVRREGWRGLFRGVEPRVAKVAPACAVMVSSYEVGKRLF
ncbi:uncharacterized protein SPPG_06245 [Spizellomyces punctatus DAOM BR117]|uniref:Mitochondrial carrier n=1 Tax=Spizellomyces punctatus (strain DAOM BR117) TaxID=645134 RepID=A0A0L0HC98_SPIPD|nr:uncharacterized protein SPPG_06245 [Spizellomyces punctatus DAOM BR117]KNC98556.1 hypothetical protein SPPG_06245 [Spizellomyces punctatus DAOM BR117]|eukprot:XP_016606596.1 hypothetical protein SPPG_06245 [Spizellomyces punctatus DAOM BR117]